MDNRETAERIGNDSNRVKNALWLSLIALPVIAAIVVFSILAYSLLTMFGNFMD
jgi:hypothetical protein